MTERIAPSGELSVTPDQWRVTDREREAASARLAVAVKEGQLDLSEYDARLQALAVVKTRGEMGALISDLQPPPKLHPDRKSGHLATLWIVWAGVVSLNIAIWLMVTMITGAGIHPWPFWVAVPTAVPLATYTAIRKLSR